MTTWRVGETDRRVVETVDGDIVADVHDWRTDTPHLIAAAPELLAACKLAAEVLDPNQGFTASDRHWLMGQLAAAIAKAEGK